ncbi:MAG: Hsp20/alpha crystallin family protein [Bacillota bacterium]
MHITNQQISGSNQVKFTPVSRSISDMGTTVSYSINPSTMTNAWNMSNMQTVSAQNMNIGASGQFGTIGQTGWNTVSYNPVISAQQFNQLQSGGILGYQQWQPHTLFVRSLIVQPTVDISETTSDVVVSACVGNLSVHDMNLNVTDNSVTISGVAWTGNEQVFLNRTVALPTSVRAESVDANFQSGVLEIRMPKTEKSIRRRATIATDTVEVR